MSCPIHKTAALLIAGLMIPAALPALAVPQMPSANTGMLSYIQGGIGDADRQSIESQRDNYNLHITSADKDGSFITDDSLTVRDSHGSVLISAREVDPLFYASLPAGHYTVTAVSDGKSETQKVFVSAHKPTDLHLTW